MKKNLSLAVFLFILSLTGFSQLKLMRKEPPEQMEKLNFLVGVWRDGENEWFDDQGNPMKIERGENAPDIEKKPYKIEPIMGGLYLEGGADGDAVRAYFYYNEGEEEYYHIAIDFMGATSIMTGDWVDGDLVLVDIKPQKHPKSGTITWRRVFYDFNKKSMSYKYEYSRDNGKTWKLRGKQTMKRVG